MKLKIEQLNAKHIKNTFDCGYDSLNDYIKLRANQDIKKDLSVCYVLVNPEYNIVIGYYTLSSSSIYKSDLPESVSKRLSYSTIPVILLGRLAIDTKYKGKGYGEALLLNAFKKSCNSSDVIGSHAIIVEPIDSRAEAFYHKFDFIKLEETGKMFISIITVRKAIQH